MPSSMKWFWVGVLTWILAISGSACFADPASGLAIERLRCEYLEDPLGMDVREPRLSWIVTSEDRGQRQTAYQILVAASREVLDKDTGDLWDTGKIESSETVLIPYQGKPLKARQYCWWKVRSWDRAGTVSTWSKPAFWSMGLLEGSDWTARWIGQPKDTYPEQGEVAGPMFRKEFKLEAKPVRATVYVAALGYYQLSFNGQRIGDDVCSPPVSDYEKRAYYITYDVTGALKEGVNCAGAWLGRGWYCPALPGVVHPGPVVRIQLEVTLDNGTVVTVYTDETWKTHAGPITALGNVRSGNLDGERYDAREEIPGWDMPGLEEKAWAPVELVNPPAPVLCAPMMELNKIRETITPVSIQETIPGEYLIDMGRNITGMLEIRLQGAAGIPVNISFNERYDAKTGEWEDYGQCGVYVPRTDQEETFRNRFNYHAFRYVKVAGLKRAPRPEDVRAFFIQTGYADRGSFECSNALLNRIYQTTLYTFRCVSAGGDTVDCPHRERLGYGGDGQITSKTALYAFDLGGLYTKWLGNWRDVQDPQTGSLPNIAPSPHGAGGGPTWGAICIFLPWDLYRHYGDRRVLQDNYAMMKKYVAFLDSKSENNQLKPFGDPKYGFLGDWVAPGHDQDIGPWSPEENRTFFNNCFYAYIADRLSDVAQVLEIPADAARFAEQAAAIRAATHDRYFKPEQQSYLDGDQATLSFALLSGVTPEKLRSAVAQQLERAIDIQNGHLDTGMHGTMFLLHSLQELRRDDLAFRIMDQKTFPGWGYMLEQGATTFWERWDGEMSQIHSTLLAAGEWFPCVLGGIQPDERLPGFKQVLIDPRPVGDLTWVKARYDTIRGQVVSEWRKEEGQFQLDVSIPANTTALVRLPARDVSAITEGGQLIAVRDDLRIVSQADGTVDLSVESGKYYFVLKDKQ